MSDSTFQQLCDYSRETALLNSIEGLSCAEIARRMGLSQTRVVQLYAQAIAACAKALASTEGSKA